MRPKIYLFGDSITEESYADGGWGSCLSNHFSRTADIVLRGYSGYNTRWALKVLDRVFPSTMEAPMAVTVFFGANDACLPDGYASFQHVPLDEYKNNLHSIFSTLKKRWPTVVILFITPPPIDEAARLHRFPYMENASGLPERTNDTAGAYAKACVDVAKNCGTLVVDLWTKMQELPDWRNICLSDGLHLAQSGNRIVFEQIVEKLREACLSLEKLPADLPLFSDIDPKDPLKAFE